MIDWLPNELNLGGTNHDEVYRRLFSQFENDFINHVPQYNGKNITFQDATDRLLSEDYPCGFTHLVTYNIGNMRVLDERRATKLSWIRPIIEHADDPAVTVYSKLEATQRYGIVLNTYLWLDEKDFLVILRLIEKGKYAGQLLTTSFCVDGHKRRKLLKDRKEILGY